METMAGRTRAAMAALSQESETVTAQALAGYLGLKTHEERSPMYVALSDMKSRGEIQDAGVRGVYRFIALKKKPFLRTVMWRILRARKSVTVDDLMELAGASQFYAREWLGMLVKREIVKKMKGGRYRLLEDVVEEPVNTDRSERLKAWRKNKKTTLAALDRASDAIDVARAALKNC